MKAADKKSIERYKKKLEFARSAGVPEFQTAAEMHAIVEQCKRDPKFMVEHFFPHYADSECADFHTEFALMVAKDPLFKGFAWWGRALAKSVWNNIFIPFWLWLRGEPVYLVVIGSSEPRAEQLLEDLRAEFETNPRIIAHFGEQKQFGTWEDGFFITKSGFIGQALGMGQSVRGLRVKNRRPTHINADDLEIKETIKNPKRQKEIARWIEKDLIPTMDGPIRRFIQSNNGFHPIMIQTILAENHPKWKKHRVNAYDPVTYKPTWHQKYHANYFKEIEDDIGRLQAMAEYNNEPHVEGDIFKNEQIQWGKIPNLNHFKIIVGHWDIAYAGNSTSDYNAVEVMGLKDTDFWHIDCFCKQSKMRAAVEWMCEFQIKLPKTVTVHWQYEAQFWNDEVERTINEVSREYGIYLNISKVTVSKNNKYDRILSLQPRYQNSRIYFNEAKKAHTDTQVGIAQLLGIEPGYKTHDDWPDAHHQCVEFLQRHIPIGNKQGNYQSGRMMPNNERL